MISKKKEIYYVVITQKDPLTNAWKKKWIRSGTSKREAEKLERKLMSEKDEGAIILTGRGIPTLLDFLTRWLDTCIKPPARKVATYTNYRAICKRIIADLGEHKLDKITPLMIATYYKELSGRGLSNTTVRLTHRILKAALDQAVKWQLLNRNPLIDVDPPAPIKPKNEALTTTDALALIEYATEQSKQSGYTRNKVSCILLLGIFCGLRRGEIAGLRWQDVDFNESTLHIRHSLLRIPISDLARLDYPYIKRSINSALVLDTVKTEASENSIIVPQHVTSFLRHAKRQYDTNRMRFGPHFHNTQLVMANEIGDPYDPNWYRKTLHKLIQSYNDSHPDCPPLPLIRVHDLRHTAATILLENDVDIKLVSRQLRHSDTGITQNLYQHVTERLESKIANTLDSLMDAANAEK